MASKMAFIYLLIHLARDIYKKQKTKQNKTKQKKKTYSRNLFLVNAIVEFEEWLTVSIIFDSEDSGEV